MRDFFSNGLLYPGDVKKQLDLVYVGEAVLCKVI